MSSPRIRWRIHCPHLGAAKDLYIPAQKPRFLWVPPVTQKLGSRGPKLVARSGWGTGGEEVVGEPTGNRDDGSGLWRLLDTGRCARRVALR
jgi:hypothetical protein